MVSRGAGRSALVGAAGSSVFRGETLAGVMPLVWDDRGDVVCFVTALSDYNDLIVAGGDVAPARLLMSVARARFRNLELACVRADSDCVQAEARVAAFGERKVVCPYAEISSGYEAWLSSRSITFRKHLKRAVRRASSHGIEVGRLDPSQLKNLDLASRFLQLHKDRFGERSLFVRDPVARAFVARALPELLARRQRRAVRVLGERAACGTQCSAWLASTASAIGMRVSCPRPKPFLRAPS